MIRKLVKLLKIGERLEISNRSTEIEVRLWNAGCSAYSVHIFNIQELEEFKGDEDLLAETLIKRLRA